LLSDYEEGTWTVAITTTTGSVTVNSSLNTAWYIKVGKLVTVGAQVNISSVSSPTGAIVIALPFATTNVSQNAGFNSGVVAISNSVSKTVRDFVGLV
jgi:hypothetical protein